MSHEKFLGPQANTLRALFCSLQYDPWGRGHGNPPMFDQQGRMVKPARRREENYSVTDNGYFC